MSAGPAVGETFVPVDGRWWISNTGGIVLTGLLAAITGRRLLRWIFGVAIGIHVVEAAYTYQAAQRAGFTRHAGRWALQTLGVGFPSLVAFHAARDEARTAQ
jgi:Domain of unknown function (DUF4499)